MKCMITFENNFLQVWASERKQKNEKGGKNYIYMTTLDDLGVLTYAFIIFQSLSCEIQHRSGDDPLSEKMTDLKICGKSEVQILILKGK